MPCFVLRGVQSMSFRDAADLIEYVHIFYEDDVLHTETNIRMKMVSSIAVARNSMIVSDTCILYR